MLHDEFADSFAQGRVLIFDPVPKSNGALDPPRLMPKLFDDNLDMRTTFL
jgi:hypothetical protein